MIADGDTYNFGTKALNSDTDTVFTIFNTGDADLTLTLPITLGGANADQFSIQAQPVSPIAPTDNTTFTVRFTPTSAGAKTATISIVNNDGDENTFDITLDGTGPAAGGGGGLPPGGTTFTNDLEVSGNTQPLVTDVDGKVQQTVQSTSEDGTVTVTVLKDTVLTDETGDPVHSLSVTVQEDPPPPPEDQHIIGLTYDFQPSGATFSEPLTITLKYTDADIPDGINEEDLKIAFYDETTGTWITLECTVDTETNTITAKVYHFTDYAVVVPATLEPAAFSISALSMSSVLH